MPGLHSTCTFQNTLRGADINPPTPLGDASDVLSVERVPESWLRRAVTLVSIRVSICWCSVFSVCAGLRVLHWVVLREPLGFLSCRALESMLRMEFVDFKVARWLRYVKHCKGSKRRLLSLFCLFSPVEAVSIQLKLTLHLGARQLLNSRICVLGMLFRPSAFEFCNPNRCAPISSHWKSYLFSYWHDVGIMHILLFRISVRRCHKWNDLQMR